MSLEDLLIELCRLDPEYFPEVRKVENSVAFILDSASEKLTAICRQVTHRHEIRIYSENELIKVVANTVYLDFETPNNNSHLEVLMDDASEAEEIHSIIENYKVQALRKFWPSVLLGRISGKSPKPLCWQIEFVTCHIANKGLLTKSGLIRADKLITDLMGGLTGEVDPKALKRKILESLY